MYAFENEPSNATVLASVLVPAGVVWGSMYEYLHCIIMEDRSCPISTKYKMLENAGQDT